MTPEDIDFTELPADEARKVFNSFRKPKGPGLPWTTINSEPAAEADSQAAVPDTSSDNQNNQEGEETMSGFAFQPGEAEWAQWHGEAAEVVAPATEQMEVQESRMVFSGLNTATSAPLVSHDRMLSELTSGNFMTA